MTPAAQAGSAAQWGPMPDASQLDAPTDPADLMNRLGGVASRSELTRWFEDAEIARAVAEGVCCAPTAAGTHSRRRRRREWQLTG